MEDVFDKLKSELVKETELTYPDYREGASKLQLFSTPVQEVQEHTSPKNKEGRKELLIMLLCVLSLRN